MRTLWDIGKWETELVFTVCLTIGMAIFVPIIGTLVLDGYFSYPVLISVILVLGLYGSLIVYTGEYVAGGLSGLVVLGTFYANVPVTASATVFPGSIVGELNLVYLPIVALCVFLLVDRPQTMALSRPGLLLLGFISWSVLSAFFGGGVSTRVALWFSLYILLGLLAFYLVQTLVQNDRTSYLTILNMVSVAILGHVAVAIIQFANQGSFGLTRLGGGATQIIGVLSLPFTQEIRIGHFISGFTGTSFNLANLLVLILPFLIWKYLRGERLTRCVTIVVISVCVFLIRVSGSDAARGAAFISMAIFIGALCLRRLSDWRARDMPFKLAIRDSVLHTLLTVSSVTLLLLPSSRSGSRSVTQVGGPKPKPDGGTTPITPSGGGGTNNGGSESLIEFFTSISIPLFDLSYLGTRIEQYIVAVNIFRSHPLFGVGGKNYILVATDYGAVASDTYPTTVHNIYFLILAETGIVGFALFFATFLLIGAYAINAIWTGHPKPGLVAAGASGLVGVFAFGFFDKLQLTSTTGFFPLLIVAGAFVGEYLRSM